MGQVQFKQNKNSELAWKRNGFYWLVSGHLTRLKHLLNYPLTSQEKARVSVSIGFLEYIIKDRTQSIEEFGKQNNFKKYQNEEI